MSIRKLSSLSPFFPKPVAIQNILSNLSEALFDLAFNSPYTRIDKLPPKRYFIGIDQDVVAQKNEYILDFDKLDLNQQFLLNKIYFAESNSLYLVGGIGTGKSRFLNELVTNFHTNKNHLCENPCKFRGLHIFIDFEDRSNYYPAFRNTDVFSIENELIDCLCKNIRSVIDNEVIDFEIELTDVWNDIVRLNYDIDAFIDIKNFMRETEASSFSNLTNPEEFKQRRMEIYNTIKANRSSYLYYLAGLLRYLKETNLNNKAACLLFVADNIDPMPLVVQKIAMETIRSFLRISGIKGIVSMRQSTFRAVMLDSMIRANESLSKYDEPVPICCPDPLEVVKQRLMFFLQTPNDYIKGLSIKNMQPLVENVKTILGFLNDRLMGDFFKAVCGHSIRKALILGRRLVSNSIYDITLPQDDKNKLDKGKLIRSILIGNKEAFEATSENVIENIYHTANQKQGPSLVKLRILRALSASSEEHGFSLERLASLLHSFGYSYDLIRGALNDMLMPARRLIWTDALTFFPDDHTFLSNQRAHIFLSTAGHGYQDWLFSNVGYIQEVMFDIPVDEKQFSSRMGYSSFEDRIKVLILFLRLLYYFDINEVHSFYREHGKEYLEMYWPGSTRLSLEIIQDVSLAAEKILSSMIRNALPDRREEHKTLRKNTLDSLSSLQVQCCNDFDRLDRKEIMPIRNIQYQDLQNPNQSFQRGTR